MLVGGGAGQRRINGRKKWDNCNSIINKMYFLKLGVLKFTFKFFYFTIMEFIMILLCLL